MATGNARAIRAGAAYIELYAHDNELVKGLNRASRRLKAWGVGLREVGTRVAAVGAGIVAPLVGAAKMFATMGDQLSEMSARTGLSVEALSELGFAAKYSGADMESLEVGVRRMQKLLESAASGSKSAQGSLALLGLTIQDLAGMNPERQFTAIADRLGRIADPTLKAATAMAIFGRSGTMLLPMMEGGAKGLDEMRQKARDLGLAISTAEAEAGHKFSKSLEVLWLVLKRSATVIGAALAPALGDLVGRVQEVVLKIMAWVKANPQVVTTIFKIALGATAAGAALVAMGGILTGMGAALKALTIPFTLVGTAVGVLGSMLASLLSPIGLVIAAVAGLGAYVLWATGAGGEALGWLRQKFTELKDDCLKAFGGISDALVAGDIGLAAKILWLTLKLEWDKGVQAVMGIAYGLMGGLRKAFINGWLAVSNAWITAVTGLKAVWVEFSTWHQRTVETWANWFAKRWIEIQGMFDKDINVEQAKGFADQITADNQSRIEDERIVRLRANEDAAKADETAAAAQHARNVAAIDAEYAAKNKANQEAVDAARPEWQAAIAAAAEKRKAADAVGGPPGRPGAPAMPGNPFDGLGNLLDQAKAKITAIGTFNAASLLGLQAGGADDRIANATERTAKGVEGLRQDVRNNLATFG